MPFVVDTLKELYGRWTVDFMGGAAIVAALYLWRGLTAALWAVIVIGVVACISNGVRTYLTARKAG